VGARDAIARLLTGIKAFHSSPHDFERFDLSKIGTGEGAQAYGHGLYFAESPAVSGQGGQYWNQFSRRFEGPEKEAASYLKAQQFDRQKAIEALRTELADEAGKNYPDFARRQETLRMLESGAPVGPRTYEVNIKADPAQMLDWDKPLSQQPQAARDVLRLPPQAARLNDTMLAKGYPEMTGGNAYGEVMAGALASPGGRNAKAWLSGQLNEAGIPGIKYLDEGSRTLAARANNPRNANWAADDAAFRATPPTSNYVVFDPANIDILKKYGIAGAAAAPVVGAAMGSTYDQGTYQEPDPMQGTYQ
jgi:hypothetical protein